MKRKEDRGLGNGAGEGEVSTATFNKKGESYFRGKNGKERKDLKNYDVVLDSSKLGIDGCVNVLKGLY